MKLRVLILLFSILAVAGKVAAQPRESLPAQEIALPSPNGDTLRLSDYKGKVVLIDFWASWCVPCRIANRTLVKFYDKYKEDGFEIYSVSLDTEPSEWMRAIEKDKIKWLQTIDFFGGFYAKTAIEWQIDALPTSFLMNRTGELVEMNLEGRKLEKAIKKLLKEK